VARLVADGGHCVELQKERTRLGADPYNEIPIQAGLGLAPTHFVIHQSLAGHVIVGEGETIVDGEPIEAPMALAHGTTIRAGGLELRYETDSPPPQVTEPVQAPSPQPQPSQTTEAMDEVTARVAPVAPAATDRWVSDETPPSFSEDSEESGSWANTLMFFGAGNIALPLFGYEFVIFSFMENTTILGVAMLGIGLVMKVSE